MWGYMIWEPIFSLRREARSDARGFFHEEIWLFPLMFRLMFYLWTLKFGESAVQEERKKRKWCFSLCVALLSFAMGFHKKYVLLDTELLHGYKIFKRGIVF